MNSLKSPSSAYEAMLHWLVHSLVSALRQQPMSTLYISFERAFELPHIPIEKLLKIRFCAVSKGCYQIMKQLPLILFLLKNFAYNNTLKKIYEMLQLKEIALAMSVSAVAFAKIFCPVMEVANVPLDTNVYSTIAQELQSNLRSMLRSDSVDEQFFCLKIHHSWQLVRALHQDSWASFQADNAPITILPLDSCFKYAIDVYKDGKALQVDVHLNCMLESHRLDRLEVRVADQIVDAESKLFDVAKYGIINKEKSASLDIISQEEELEVIDVNQIDTSRRVELDVTQLLLSITRILFQSVLSQLEKVDHNFLKEGSIGMKYMLKSNRDCERDLGFVQHLLGRNVNYQSIYIEAAFIIRHFPPDLFITNDAFSKVFNIVTKARSICDEVMKKPERCMAKATSIFESQRTRVEEQQKSGERELYFAFCQKYVPGFMEMRSSYTKQKNRIEMT